MQLQPAMQLQPVMQLQLLYHGVVSRRGQQVLTCPYRR